MTLKYSISCKNNFSATVKLMELMNSTISNSMLPETRYMLDKFCNTNNNVEFHAVCPHCSCYLGTFEDVNIDNYMTCPNERCLRNVNVSSHSSPRYFVVMDPSYEVSNYLKIHADYYDYVVKDRKVSQDSYKDIYDGD